jgi:diguanylate cyclase (GGDEF)-like protein
MAMREPVPDHPIASGRRGSLRALRWLGALGAAVALGVLALGGWILLDLRRDTWRRAELASANLVQALERDIARNMALYDLSLSGVAAALRQPGIDQASPEIRHLALFDRATSAEYLGSVLFVGPDGRLQEASTSLSPPKLALADRDYFRVHQERRDAGLFVSRPFHSRLREGDPSIALSRRIEGPDGRFLGVAVGTLRLAYFQDLFNSLDLGPRGSVTLFRSDGRVVARYPFREEDIDRDLSAGEAFAQFRAAPAGSFVGIAAIDQVRRQFSFRHIANFPLILSVNRGVEDIFSEWWSKAVTIGLILGALCSALVVLCLLFRREMLRRLGAEEQLTAAAEAQAVAARTDSLTGLANRRHFDEVLDLECRRAAREELPLSLLLLDVDRFKLFNDHYGHRAGDDCLRAVAAAVQGAIRRPADLAARYGGEEVAVILPNTEASGALHMAERVREAVQALGLVHEANPESGVVTASIGCATVIPRPGLCGEQSPMLVQEADQALYEAKRLGRNRSVAAPALQAGQVHAPAGHGQGSSGVLRT